MSQREARRVKTRQEVVASEEMGGCEESSWKKAAAEPPVRTRHGLLKGHLYMFVHSIEHSAILAS